MAKPKYMTNKQVIKEITEHTVVGHSFIVQALQHYTRDVIKDGLKDWPDNTYISKELWLDQANNTLATLEKAYG
jgi:hypothetical protein